MAHDTLYAIGEALIDMIPAETGCDFGAVSSFAPRVGGAPANVAAAFARLGGRSALLTQLGDDPFGAKNHRRVGRGGCGREPHCHHRPRQHRAGLCLAAGGRQPYLQLLPQALGEPSLQPGAGRLALFTTAFALHFCSVSLVESPMREAHKAAIAAARQAGALVSFDPNLRFPLWPDREALYRTVWEFLPQADILKVSDEELEFLTGTTDIEKALPKLFTGHVQLVVTPAAAPGPTPTPARPRGLPPSSRSRPWTLPARGDGFIGSFLWQLCRDGVTVDSLPSAAPAQLEQWLAFSNRYCGESVQRYGAIASYPTAAQMGV